MIRATYDGAGRTTSAVAEIGNQRDRRRGKKPNVVSRHRAAQAQKDFDEYGEPELRPQRRASDQLAAVVPKAAGTHGHGAYCPGSIAFGLLGGGVWRPGSTGQSGT